MTIKIKAPDGSLIDHIEEINVYPDHRLIERLTDEKRQAKEGPGKPQQQPPCRIPDGDIRSRDEFLNFVGVEAYLKAGGRTEEYCFVPFVDYLRVPDAHHGVAMSAGAGWDPVGNMFFDPRSNEEVSDELHTFFEPAKMEDYISYREQRCDYIDVDPSRTEEAKALGAKFDVGLQSWAIPKDCAQAGELRHRFDLLSDSELYQRHFEQELRRDRSLEAVNSKDPATYQTVPKDAVQHLADKPTVLITNHHDSAELLHKVTGHPVVVSHRSANYSDMAHLIRQQNPAINIVIAADNHHSGVRNLSLEDAKGAARATSARIILPDFSKAEKSGVAVTWNDMSRIRGVDQTKAALQHALKVATKQQSTDQSKSKSRTTKQELGMGM